MALLGPHSDSPRCLAGRCVRPGTEKAAPASPFPHGPSAPYAPLQPRLRTPEVRCQPSAWGRGKASTDPEGAGVPGPQPGTAAKSPRSLPPSPACASRPAPGPGLGACSMPGPSLLVALCGALLCVPGLSASSGDFCDSSQCLNGGTCLLSQGRPPFYCLCPQGFTGAICNETEKGPCYPNPCHNDGECQVFDEAHRGDVFTQYICKCPHGYLGIHCETICAMPLGMEKGSILDSQISASSVHLGFMGLQRWAPELARLHRTGIVNAWTASNYDRTPWIQVNLLRKMRVTGVVTQGASRTGSAEYLKSFKVAYSADGRKFQFMKDSEGLLDRVYVGNMDNNGLKVNLFEIPLEVQYVRIVPIICHRGCTLRFELLGCELNGCSDPLGMKDNTITDRQITASSIFRTWGLSAFSWFPFYGRLDRQGKFNAWTAQSNSASEWLQIDLGSPKRVTGIITQGARDFGHVQYVAAYKIAHSENGQNWTEYHDPGTLDSKIFPGNLDNDSHKKNVFESPFVARFVRVLPVAWHNRITLRVELLGC